MKWRISHPKDGFPVRPGSCWVRPSWAPWSQAGQESPRKQADSSMFKARKKSARIAAKCTECQRSAVGGQRSEVRRCRQENDYQKYKKESNMGRTHARLLKARTGCLLVHRPPGGGYFYCHPTAALPRFYSNPTPILPQSYSGPTRLLLAFCSRSALENRQKQAICSMFRAKKKTRRHIAPIPAPMDSRFQHGIDGHVRIGEHRQGGGEIDDPAAVAEPARGPAA